MGKDDRLEDQRSGRDIADYARNKMGLPVEKVGSYQRIGEAGDEIYVRDSDRHLPKKVRESVIATLAKFLVPVAIVGGVIGHLVGWF
jgi:hypothetical protein